MPLKQLFTEAPKRVGAHKHVSLQASCKLFKVVTDVCSRRLEQRCDNYDTPRHGRPQAWARGGTCLPPPPGNVV